MSCCAPKIGLARLAEHPGVILFAYLCALLPLAAIYALDFINKDWKSIRDTRRGGQIHLAFSLPPLAVVIFYIHLQRLSEDYKEMATAITAAILCILHVLRTVWGLLQVRAFKEWNMHALQVLVRMGFDAPIYVSRDEAQMISDFENHQPRPSLLGSHTERFPSPFENESLRNPVSKWFTKRFRNVRELLGLDKPDNVSARNEYFSGINGPSAKQIERTIDMHMIVNNSLVDNEFSGADLPCRPNFELLWNPIPKTGLRAIDLLNCRKSEECAIRWTVSFLARFGSEWLIGATQPAIEKKSDRFDRDVLRRENLANRLAAYVACIITHTVDIELESGWASSQQISFLSPLHVLCADLMQPWVPILKVTDKNCLPYQLRGGIQPKEVIFEDHTISIQNCVSAWANESLNELHEKEEKNAVLNISAHQVAWFLKLMEEQDTHVPKILQAGFYYDENLKMFFWQLGYECKPLEIEDRTVQDILNDICCSMPVLIHSLRSKVHRDYDMLQASVHADNWLALQASNFPVTSDDVQDELTEVEVRQYGQVFCEQKRLEMRRLQLQMASENGQYVVAVGKIKFLGCMTEMVRSSLAEELLECGFGSDSTSSDDWRPLIREESCTVVCSDQLYTALYEADSSSADNVDTSADKFEQQGLQMRVLWEMQRALMSPDGRGPGSSASMMLCMLGYPSLRISKIGKCPPVYPSAERNINGHVSIPVGGSYDTDEGQRDRTGSGEPARRSTDCREEKRSCLRIDIVEAPQPLHITFQWTAGSNTATAQIGVNEGHMETRFCWQRWKDGFMGRLCAQSNWRSTHLHNTNEMMRKQAIVSKLTAGVSEFSREEETGIPSRPDERTMAFWLGWPPFLSMIAQFERNSWCRRPEYFRILSFAELEKELDRFCRGQFDEISDCQGLEAEINAMPPEPECDCGCEGHELFLEAKELLEKGKEESLKLFIDCMIHHKHFLALEHFLSIAISHPDWHRGQIDFERAIIDAIERTSTGNMEVKCRKFKQYDLESVIELLDDHIEKTGDNLVLLSKAKLLLLWSLDEYSVDERCIETFERLVLLLQEDPRSWFLEMSRICLAMCFFQRYCSTGNQSDEEVGIHHCLRLSEEMDEEIRISDSDCVPMAFLIEKGSVSIREYERISPHLNILPDVKKIMENMFLLSSKINHRLSRNTNAAFTIYSRVVARIEPTHTKALEGMASTRLALMYHRGADGVAKDLAKAEELYMTVWDPTYRMHALCNLGVLYGQRNESIENGEESVKLFGDAIDAFEEEERYRMSESPDLGLYKHSSSMNNLAVLMESGQFVDKDIEQAKKMYLRAVEIDENPIAMYNLAVLLKFGDPSGENLEKAEELFSTVANLGVDLQSIPVLASQLEKARLVSETEPSAVFRYDVDEIDDCLAYVKIVDSSA